MKKLMSILLTLALVLALVPAGMAEAEKPAPTLEGITNYVLVLDLTDPEKIDAEGRALVWEGEISGDIKGVIQWWVPWPPSTHYDDLCVILDEAKENVLMEVLESGSTTYRDPKHPGDKDPIWRTNGVVTYASGDYTAWVGRQTHADGDADMQASPPCGTGTFRVN